jgi:hypothetical protein
MPVMDGDALGVAALGRSVEHADTCSSRPPGEQMPFDVARSEGVVADGLRSRANPTTADTRTAPRGDHGAKSPLERPGRREQRRL